ncbi:MAG: flagellar motor switch protein FliG [Armatimonadetes bacterium]|nr:flagellar motor switch protein FliG [Armatimonadota bacterium]MDW8027476.1 flagellar motor switch protein FliG [Armatimonadota bacterium]
MVEPQAMERVTKTPKGLNGKRKAAVLLSLLPPDEAAAVLKQLDENEVELLLSEMAKLGVVAENIVQQLVDEALQRLQTYQPIATGGTTKVRTLLIQAFGVQQGSALWSRLEALLKEPTPDNQDVELLSKLSAVPPQHLVELVRNENPQAIALLLGLLPPSHGSAILNELSPELRSEVALRLLITESPPEEVLDTLRRSLQDAIAPATQRTARFNGLQVLVQIMSNLPREVMQEILDNLEQRNPELAERVQQAMFTFEDLVKLDDRSLQRILREVDMRELALALKGASEELKEKIFHNMSQRAAQILREEMDYMGPVRLRDVTAAQRRVVDIVRKLEEAGEITVPRGGEEVLV